MPRAQAAQERRFDTVQVHLQARELCGLAKSLPVDLDRLVSQGILPKDTIEKLKRIEKLS